ncbi:hypothetical protein DK926_07245 [Rhodococcus sp. Eu-32]|uniref:hypothetical protein n=1 Tax=Rhodococcus sp. Eu-32 TaxID=1017319 RepID=UPI000DF1834B|nr:hypothetical protein [Rhodococcus sp. Eu-32]RRQ28629.1 hypothetical protein DK926_07245 [Rhodococcus sp. Eu-32]
MKRLRRQRLLRGMSVPDPFSIDRLCDEVTDVTGRPLRVESAALPYGVAGALFRSETSDVIVHDQALPRLARLNTILHEVGHVILGHDSARGDDVEPIEFSVLMPDAVANFRCSARRTDFTTGPERDAELFARATLRRILESNTEVTAAGRLWASLTHPVRTHW